MMKRCKINDIYTTTDNKKLSVGVYDNVKQFKIFYKGEVYETYRNGL